MPQRTELLSHRGGDDISVCELLVPDTWKAMDGNPLKLAAIVIWSCDQTGCNPTICSMRRITAGASPSLEASSPK
jgi:protocatechuate 3,4-dioxygenase beta subunit